MLHVFSMRPSQGGRLRNVLSKTLAYPPLLCLCFPLPRPGLCCVPGNAYPVPHWNAQDCGSRAFCIVYFVLVNGMGRFFECSRSCGRIFVVRNWPSLRPMGVRLLLDRGWSQDAPTIFERWWIESYSTLTPPWILVCCIVRG
jgi:hypothetical protein